MPRLRHTIALAVFILGAVSAAAQSYTPKTIRIEGAGTMSKADILHTAQLTEGAPLSKEQIEAGLKRLGDTGAFTELGYTVDGAALTLKLTPSAGRELLPVHFVNFVWWTPDELTRLLTRRVPLFQGKLPQTGSLTDQVEAALIALLKEKGISASVTTVESRRRGMGLAIAHPDIVLGEVTVLGSLPVVASDLARMQDGFRAQEFDSAVTATAISRNVTDVYNNAGFLDAATDPPRFAPPRKDPPAGGDLARFVVDASTTVHPGEPYRIRSLFLEGPPPLSRADLSKAAALKSGDLAGAFTLQHAGESLANAYSNAGFLDARTSLAQPRDPSTHAVDCTFTVTPGEIYHVAHLDTSALPAAQASALAAAFHVSPGTIANQDFEHALFAALTAIHAERSTRINLHRNPADHTVIVLLKPAARSQ